MRNSGICFLLISFVVCVGHVRGEFNQEEWRATYDHPKVKAATKRWLEPGPELEKYVRERVFETGTIPKDPARAERYVKEYIAFTVSYYLTVYKGTKIDTQLARQVLANPDFSEEDIKKKAYLLLYIDSGNVSYLKQYLLSSGFSPKLFLRVHDPAVVRVALEIVGEAYKERFEKWYEDPRQGRNFMGVAAGLPGFAGMMYVQRNGNVSAAKALFRDFRLSPPILGAYSVVASVDMALMLYHEAPRRALEDFLYAMYETGMLRRW